MVSEAERIARAGEYVLGRMSAAERERAERDLETDAEFRMAVMMVAERARRFGRSGGADAVEAGWSDIARRLEALPHMRSGRPLDGHGAPVLPVVEPGPRRQGWAGVVWVRFESFLRRLSVRARPVPEAVAVLCAGPSETVAVVETAQSGALRLLLLQSPRLEDGEQLSLWGVGGDGAYHRLGGFAAAPETRIAAAGVAERYAGYALARERVSTIPSSQLHGVPFAEGPAQTLTLLPDPPAPSGKARGSAKLLTLKRR
jgi:anti-sigma-K factor RskA